MRTLDLKTYVQSKMISTVNLPESYDGMNLGSFETMIQGYKGEWEDYSERYDTEEEAVKGHMRAIQHVMGLAVDVKDEQLKKWSDKLGDMVKSMDDKNG